jgi:hypothetical protein
MSAPARQPVIEPTGFRPAGEFPCTNEGIGLALLYLIVEQDRSLTSRTADQPVAAYLLDLYGECLRAANGERDKDRGTIQ